MAKVPQYKEWITTMGEENTAKENLKEFLGWMADCIKDLLLINKKQWKK